MAVVTSLRAAGRKRVAVELDGDAWRTLPTEAVLRAGLAVGRELDRPTARRLAREVRRLRALGVATGALRYRDHTRRSLEERLARRGVAPEARREAVATLARAGIVDDERYAMSRAAQLAHRGYGDAYIRHDLAARGLPSRLVGAALDALDPEAERVAGIATGSDPAATARQLLRRGFAPESLEPLMARTPWGEIG